MAKRLAFISYHTCPLADHEGKEIGGMSTYIMGLTGELAKKGYVIDIYTRVQDESGPKIVQVSKNLRVIHIKAGDKTKISKMFLIQHIPEFLSNFYSFVQKENLQYELLSCHYYLSGIIGLAVKKKFNLPLFMSFHTLGLMKNLVARGEEEKEDIRRIKAEIELVKRCDKILATSQTDAIYIRTLYQAPREKVTVLFPGVDLTLFSPMPKIKAKELIGAQKKERIILFVGRVEPLKGIDVLIYAVKMLLETKIATDISLWIVGGDVQKPVEYWSKELKKLEQLRKLLQVTTSVHFVGSKDRKELPYYYNAAEIAVMPSHYESFGITALEAMACGTPVITTDVTGVSELFDEKLASLVTSANNPILLARKIRNLLSDEDEYQQLSKEVLQSVEPLSWEHVAEKFIAIIQ